MSKIRSLKQYCFSVFNIRVNNKILCNKKLRNYWNKFKNLIAKLHNET